MPTYVIRNKTHIACVSSEIDSADEVLAIVKEREPKIDWKECFILPRGKHLCKYCGEVTAGLCEDLLCNSCKECFGHSLYSEL